MSDVLGANQTLIAANSKAGVGDVNGTVKSLCDTYTFPANAFTLNDRIKIGTVPKGARIVGGYVSSPSLGTTGIFDLGSTADADGVVDGADAGGQAVYQSANGSLLGAQMTEDTDIYLKCVEAPDTANALVIKAGVLFVKD